MSKHYFIDRISDCVIFMFRLGVLSVCSPPAALSFGLVSVSRTLRNIWHSPFGNAHAARFLQVPVQTRQMLIYIRLISRCFFRVIIQQEICSSHLLQNVSFIGSLLFVGPFDLFADSVGSVLRLQVRPEL